VKSLLPLLAGVLLLNGCTVVGPDYVRPDVDTPTDFRFGTDETRDLANVAWWSLFEDPTLDALVDTALRNNKDVRLAAQRVLQFAAQVDVTRAGLYPQIGYEGFAGRSKSSLPGGGSLTDDSFLAALNLGWELDVWGRLQRATEAELATLLAAEETRSGVILSLVSAVATAYVRLLNLDEQLEVTHKTVASREESLRLFQLQFDGGVVSELEVAQVRSELELARIRIPQIERQIALLENGLSVLLGQNPGPIVRERDFDALAMPPVPAGLPSDLLQRRPDIRAAEQNLIAANALIGVAEAQYFPRISLTGLFGFASNELSSLLDSDSNIWSYSGGLLGPIFDGGRIDADIRASEATQRQALIDYRRVVQEAFREVDDALIDLQKRGEITVSQQRQLKALRDYARFANLRYDEGQVSYIEVLDAERRLFDAELSDVINRGDVTVALIGVYKAMGGGWVETSEATANTVDYAADADEQGEDELLATPVTLPRAMQTNAPQATTQVSE
jgi:multidrug efflux system outer membrane protein